MDNVKEQYIDKIKNYVKINTDKAKIFYDNEVDDYNNFISNNCILLEEFIESIDINIYIENININFNYVCAIYN